MNILIKGLDLPKNIQAIQISYWTKDGHYIAESYPPSRIVEIPTPHGRLGDLDELQKAIRTDIMGGLNYEHFIRNAPTILEAEE